MTGKTSRVRARRTVLCALFGALLCILSPLSLPIGPVPLSLCSFGILLSGVVLGPLGGALSTAVLLSAGLCGLPVFSGGMSGITAILSPTGGYIMAYPIMAALAGLSNLKAGYTKNIGRRHNIFTFLCCLAAVILGYVMGTAWFSFSAGLPVSAELIYACVLPFAVPDLLKCIAATALGELILRRIGSGMMR